MWRTLWQWLKWVAGGFNAPQPEAEPPPERWMEHVPTEVPQAETQPPEPPEAEPHEGEPGFIPPPWMNPDLHRGEWRT